MGTLIQSFIEQSEKRLTELQPAVDEAQEIREVLESLGHKFSSRKTGARRGPRRNGGRRKEFLALVGDNPGITVSEAAKKMRINPNYLYRLSSDAVKDGTVRKEGKGYVLTPSSAETTGEAAGDGDGGKDK